MSHPPQTDLTKIRLIKIYPSTDIYATGFFWHRLLLQYTCVVYLDSNFLSRHMNMQSKACIQSHNEVHVSSTIEWIEAQCYRRPLPQAWLLPDLNMIHNNCVTENSL